MAQSNKVKVCLKTMADLQLEKASFYIDAYQRGYRWTQSEVRALLEDIREFSQTPYKGNGRENDKFYCLQPIIVTQNESGQWKVIDGQQRLTTLFLIYTYYINNLSERMKPNHPFELHYKNKATLEECLDQLKSGDFYSDDDFDVLTSYLEDIDCYFVIEAYKEISRYFRAIYENPKVQNQVNDMKSVFDNYMKIIWYELVDCDSEQEVTIFTKVNMGKIPLTNAELIKALLLKDDGEDIKSYQENIAVKWDDIEAKLLDETFWSFLVNGNIVYSTRIDFIFDIMAHDVNETILKAITNQNESYYVEKKYNPNYFSFYVFNNYMRYLDSNPETSKAKIKTIWDKICEYYRMFNDWYKHRTWYHLIGYNIYNSGKKNIEKIYDLSNLYKKNEIGKGHKTFFESELKKMTIKSLLKNNATKEDLANFISSLSYGSDNNKIKSILLVYNLAVLEVEEKTDVRFAFDKFKEKNAWDIEHINAVADGRPSDEADIDTNECLIWLQNSLNLPDLDKITYDNNRPIKELIDEVIANKLYLYKNNNTKFVKVYETIVKYFNGLAAPNNIGNLTLLDAATNRSYKNDVFPLKRKKIIERCCSEAYIPLGTKKVFLKAYLESNNLLKWTQDDFDNYVDDIIDKIAIYLGL